MASAQQYTRQELLSLVKDYRTKLQAYNLSIHLYDSEHTNYYTISEFKHQRITDAIRDKYDYLIVLLGEQNTYASTQTTQHPTKSQNIYFCSTIKEIQTILNFMISYPEIYTPTTHDTDITNDVYNNAHMRSLDTL